MVATGESERELHVFYRPFIVWVSLVTPFGMPLEPCYAPSMPAIRPAASSRSRADGSACSELDTEEAGGVRRPSSEAWMDATWKRNTQYISTKSPTLFTPLSRRASANFDGITHQLLDFKDVQKGRKDAPGKRNIPDFPFMKKMGFPLNEEPRRVPPPEAPLH